MKRPRVVQVKWLDHAHYMTDVDVALYVRWTVGFLIREDDVSITLAGTWDDDAPVELTIIGKPLVVSRRVLK